ncbi:hypothetical protein [Marinobacterium stanieri]|uniref:hypothetical protein n=1 Tax=Marinobacterium stanieri TaxID=49186 RepID=UPI000255A602|nr:hypothetical protein [Marinobacterium stanieri]
MTLLTRDQILAADDIKSEVVEVPEWGGSVRVATMSGQVRDRFEATCIEAGEESSMENVRAKMVAFSIVDEQGELVFSVEHIQALGGKSSKALDRVFDVSQRLSKITADEVEELAKN